jgi:predicted TIM-barrel fold metal-dependent hydrolase
VGFTGAVVNPDPYENGAEEPPPMYDRYWYPLYEKFVDLGAVAYIHSCSSRSDRAPYSMNFVAEETIAILNLLNGPVFQDFPDLKVVVSHGGGSVPYQVGRFEAGSVRRNPDNRFTKRMRNLYYDTCLYTKEAIELLVKVVGADRCMFGSECPGTGTTVDPDDGHQYDDVASYILDIEWLSQDEKDQMLYKNAVELFQLDVEPRL